MTSEEIEFRGRLSARNDFGLRRGVRLAWPGGRGDRQVVARLGGHGHGGLARSNERMPYDPELVTKTVVFWKKQADRDPEGALERRELAAAYLARHRETGDIADAVKAEAAARQSLEDPPPQ